MTKLFIYCLLFVEVLIVLSQAMQLSLKTLNKDAGRGQLVIAASYVVSCVAIIVTLLSGDSPVSFVFYTISWFGMVMLLASFIQSAAKALGQTSKILDVSFFLFFYYSIFLYFTDVILCKGSLKYGNVSVSVPMTGTVQIILHIIFLILYLACLVIFLKQYYDNHEKKRERYLVYLGAISFSFSVIGVIFAIISLIYGYLDILPVFICSVGTILCYPKVAEYHKSIQMTEADFKEYLREDSKDAVLICDDEYNICFNSKKASVIAESMKGSFVGRKLSDVFILSSLSEDKLVSGMNEEQCDIPAVYGPMDCKIELHLENSFDKYGEFFSSIVSVTGLDDESVIRKDELKKIESVKKKEEPVIIKDEEFSITKGARILIVCENSLRVNVFEKMMQPYMMSIFRALNSEQAMRDIVENTYDMIFVDRVLSGTSAYEFATKIRNIDGDYYSEVPLILCTEDSMDDQFKVFIESGYNDYLKKPISAKHLNMILSRWLWKRYSKNEAETIKVDGYEADSELTVLNDLIMDCDLYYDQNETNLFAYTLQGIKKMCLIRDYVDEERAARDIIKAVMFDDISSIEKSYRALSGALKQRLKG